MTQVPSICFENCKRVVLLTKLLFLVLVPSLSFGNEHNSSLLVPSEENPTLVKKQPLKFVVTSAKKNRNSNSNALSQQERQIELNQAVSAFTSETVGESLPKLRSPFLAAVFSAVVPGLGELYAENYWKAALFFAIEGFLWYRHISLLNEGHRAEQNFVTIANERWSPVRYAERLKTIYATDSRLASNGRPLSELSATMDLNAIAQKDFRTLNQFERLALYSNGNALSHTLPSFGSQQYYELIGKYDNFYIGWDDYDVTRLSANFTVYEGLYGQEYSQIRQNANDVLGSASTFISLIILNHVLSLADAIWSTAEYNKSVRASFQLSQNPLTGFLQPEARISIGF